MFNCRQLTDEVIDKVATPATHGYIELSDKADSSSRCVILQKFLDMCAEEIKNFEVYEDDVWVVTFPKCGTTWTQEMVWLLNSDLDYRAAMETRLVERFPFIERGGISHLVDHSKSVKICRNLARPRHIKSHLPVFLLPDQLWTVKPKIIYCARNPKDAAISYFHHYKHLQAYTGTKEAFLNAFLDDKVLYSPMNDHVLDFWKLAKENSNILFLFFEDRKKDLDGEVKRVAKFLGKSYSQEEIDNVCNHLSVDSMRKNPSCNYEDVVRANKSAGDCEKFQFIREGQSGGHKKEMSGEEIERFDKFMEYVKFKENGFAYEF